MFLTVTQKNCGVFAITANTPLLNLNLNYEKLRHKYNSFYQNNNKKFEYFCALHLADFGIFKYQYLFSMLIEPDFGFKIGNFTCDLNNITKTETVMLNTVSCL